MQRGANTNVFHLRSVIRPSHAYQSMSSLAPHAEALPDAGASRSNGAPIRERSERSTQPGVLIPWIRTQALNLVRHTGALQDFTRTEFGTGPEAPTEGHIAAVNQLMSKLRVGLDRRAREMVQKAAKARQSPDAATLADLTDRKSVV